MDAKVDWLQCELVESLPGKVSGKPVVRGTRVMPDAIVNSFELGESVAQIHEGFPSLTEDQIRGLIAFAEAAERNLAA